VTLEPALADVLNGAASAPFLLVVVDYDGTLAPIVDVPADAAALPGALDALRDLAALPSTHVAVVSGRARADLVQRVPVDGAHLVGSHGAEEGDDDTDALTVALADGLRSTVDALVGGVAGVLLEPKPTGVAVHVRNASDSNAAEVLRTLEAGPLGGPDVFAVAGKEVLELSVVPLSKGAAVERLRARLGRPVVVFAGDDVTDETVQRTLEDGDVGIKVGPGDTAAPYRVDSPDEVVDVLRTLAAARSQP
jgi:trehalose 6-phosphate phosphatase